VINRSKSKSAINDPNHQPSVPSGKRLHNYGKIHHAITGKTHYFDWAIFNSKLSAITRGIQRDHQTLQEFRITGFNRTAVTSPSVSLLQLLEEAMTSSERQAVVPWFRRKTMGKPWRKTNGMTLKSSEITENHEKIQ